MRASVTVLWNLNSPPIISVTEVVMLMIFCPLIQHWLANGQTEQRSFVICIQDLSNTDVVWCLGDSKGYGFVEYTTKEAALQAKNMLDGKQVENWILCCDWLDSSHITFDSLHSKCLYVDNLPKDFRDMGEFRKVFGSVVNPPYCQVRMWHLSDLYFLYLYVLFSYFIKTDGD